MTAPPRRRDAAATRAAILDAARGVFARDGYDRATIRTVAAEAGIDPALVVRYFGGKAGLFAAAAELRLDLPDLAGLTPEQMADALVTRFLEVWEQETGFAVLLRACATSEEAAERLRQAFREEVAPVVYAVAPDDPHARAVMMATQVLGFAFVRYVLRLPPLVDMTHDEVRRWLGPALIHHLLAPVS